MEQDQEKNYTNNIKKLKMKKAPVKMKKESMAKMAAKSPVKLNDGFDALPGKVQSKIKSGMKMKKGPFKMKKAPMKLKYKK